MIVSEFVCTICVGSLALHDVLPLLLQAVGARGWGVADREKGNMYTVPKWRLSRCPVDNVSSSAGCKTTNNQGLLQA